MKRTRTVSVEIEYRETSIFLTLSDPPAHAPTPLDSGPIPTVCPICGSPWVFVTPKAGAPLGMHIEAVRSAFEQFQLHPPVFAGGMFLICRQSIEQLKERL
jgi:hypothetical protein